MKKIIFIMGMFLVSRGYGWEQPRNPDRFISIGLGVNTHYTSGDYSVVSRPTPGFALAEFGDAKTNYTGLGANLRIPANESLTLDLNYERIDGEQTHSRNNDIYSDSTEIKGYQAGIGIRLYLNK